MVLEAQTIGEHKMWVNGLVHFCPRASISGVQSKTLAAVQARLEAKVHNEPARDESSILDQELCESPAEWATQKSASKSRVKDRDHDRDRGRKEDHRKAQGFKALTGEGATSRLHSHIRGDDRDMLERNAEVSSQYYSLSLHSYFLV
jgi:hypothetical protein